MSRITRARSIVPGWRRRERGFALPLAMIATFLILVCGLAFVELTRMEGTAATVDRLDTQALAAAEQGLERARAMSVSQNRPWSTMTYNGQSLTYQESNDPRYSGHSVCTVFEDQPVGSDPNITLLRICGGFERRRLSAHERPIQVACVRERQRPDAPYIHPSPRRSPTRPSAGSPTARTAFTSPAATEWTGWVHTNDTINIYGSPQFTGKVSSAASRVNYAHGGPPWDSPDFQMGLELDKPVIDIHALINAGHVSAIRNLALQPDGLWLGSNGGRPYLLEFKANGTVQIKKQRPRGNWEMVANGVSLGRPERRHLRGRGHPGGGKGQRPGDRGHARR